MCKDFKLRYGPWALITGATSGIGAEFAKLAAEKGLNIILVARKENELREHAARLESNYGIETKQVPADLSTAEGVEKIKQLSEEIGLLIVAAGLEENGAFEKTSLEKELKVIQLNVVSTLQLTHHFSREMVKRRRGGILMIASLSGHMPNPYFSNYAGTKAYILNFGASLYGELKRKGIDVSVLSPGLTKTPMVADNGIDWDKTPLKTMSPAEVAAEGFAGIGKKFLVVPGRRNKMMAWMSKHSPLSMQAAMNEKMVRKAIKPEKI